MASKLRVGLLVTAPDGRRGVVTIQDADRNFYVDWGDSECPECVGEGKDLEITGDIYNTNVAVMAGHARRTQFHKH